MTIQHLLSVTTKFARWVECFFGEWKLVAQSLVFFGLRNDVDVMIGCICLFMNVSQTKEHRPDVFHFVIWAPQTVIRTIMTIQRERKEIFGCFTIDERSAPHNTPYFRLSTHKHMHAIRETIFPFIALVICFPTASTASQAILHSTFVLLVLLVGQIFFAPMKTIDGY